MNIDNSIGMALFSGESGAAAMNCRQGLADGTAASSEGSLFQQLMNQMLMGKSQTADAESGNLNSGEQNKTGKTGDMLSELLLAAGTLSKGGFQKTDIPTGGSSEIRGASDDKQADGENAEAAQMLQALMAGMTNASQAVNIEKTFMAPLTEKLPEPQLAAVNAAGAASGNPAAMEVVKQMTNNTVPQPDLSETAAPAGGKAVAAETADGMAASQIESRQIPAGQTGIAQTAARLDSAVSSSGKPTADMSAEFQETEKTVLTETESGKLTATPGIRNREDFTIPAEKLKQQPEPAEEADPGKMGIRNSVQGAVITGEITGSDAPAQPVRSPEPYSQIREEILAKLEQNGPTEFKMQLEPEDLGQIDIKLKLSEGKLVIDILAANSKTQALLTSQIDKLVASMGFQNAQVESVQVGQHMNSQTQDNSQSPGFTMNSAMDFSQRRQQELYRPEIINSSKPAGTFSLQQDEAKTSETVSRIESTRFDTHRMNYSV